MYSIQDIRTIKHFDSEALNQDAHYIYACTNSEA
jgi:hypothetical protein